MRLTIRVSFYVVMLGVFVAAAFGCSLVPKDTTVLHELTVHSTNVR